MKSSCPTSTYTGAQQGFTLLELLLAVSLGSVVLAFLGGVLLVSEIKVSANIQRNLDTKDAANRAITLMRSEANSARSFTRPSPFPSATPLADCIDATPLAYLMANNAIICYKTVPKTALDSVYQSAFRGPCVLVRRGPPYRPNGELDTSAQPIVQVLLDSVGFANSTTSSCLPATGLTVTMRSGFSRSVDLAIGASGAIYRFSAQASSNPAYNGNDLWNPCITQSIVGCGLESEATYHYKPSMTSQSQIVDGIPAKENIFYFEHPRSEYIIRGSTASNPCTYSVCNVMRGSSNVQLSSVDSLIFPDKEIRPTR